MQLRDIAIKNLQRRKYKILFLVFGMVFGIATIVTLFTLTNAMEKSINKKIEKTGLKLAVTPETDTISFSVGGIPIVPGVSYNVENLSSDTVERINSVTNADKIKVIAPKVMGTTLVNKRKVLAVGVDFPSEFKIKSWWQLVGGDIPAKGNEVLVGVRAAEKLNLYLGKDFKLNGRSFTVSGILEETGEEEDGIIFLNLKEAQEVFGKQGKYSFIELTTAKDEKIAEQISGDISKEVPGANVKIVKEAAEARQELVGKFSKFSLVVSLVMILIAALIVVTNMMASVNERTREIGVFRAIGFRKEHVRTIILTEAGLVCGVSAVIGYLVGMGAAKLVAPLFSTFSMEISWNPFFGVIVLVGAVLLGVVAGMYPASKAAQLDPAEALRYI